MGFTVRDYRLVKGQTVDEALVYLAEVWEGRPSRPTSLVMRVQLPDETASQTYSYECHSLLRAAEIVIGTHKLLPEGALALAYWTGTSN
jgi:hypothetical protein